MAGAAMAKGPSALQALKGDQALASAPDGHVWLSASAGTGKTHVLTARVYRLLLSGVRPENILCLTFTKAGAAEMAERIHNRLAAWVQMDDPALFSDLEALGEPSGPDARETARRLFAEVLEATGGGLRIQTIHAFCQQLLSAFPVEAGLIPGFRPLEARAQAELARQTLADIVLRAEAGGDHKLIAAMQALSLRLGEGAAEAYLMRCARHGDAMAQLPSDIRAWLFAALDLPEGDIEAAIAAACADDQFDMRALARIAAANAAWGTASGLTDADRIGAWRAANPEARAATLTTLVKVFHTDKGEPRKYTAKLIAADADYAGLAVRLGERCRDLLNLRDRAAYAAMLAEALEAGRAYALAYAEAKRAAGAVDFDDLIARAKSLLGTPGMGDWVRYKLDQQTDHILVDEAQDTNNEQWDIVKALAEEYFAGEGAKGDRLRTLFTVGDFKQAIFGFQGTSPEAFEKARAVFHRLAEGVSHPFHNLSLDQSFRSTPPVLDVVDATLAALPPGALGFAADGVRHVSANRHPGEVLLLPPVSVVRPDGADEDGEPEGEESWLSDQDRLLAGQIADQVRLWTKTPTLLASKGRDMTAGDVMILVRKRGDLARLIVARLYEADVNVAGIDRLRLNAPLAVRDLLAALRFAVQPEDDLNLANLLVSPLIGWSQGDLFDRAHGRRIGLWAHLRATVDETWIAPLRHLLAQADFTTPYRYLEHILSGPMQGRRALIGRLGSEARDPIEELLNAALAFETDSQPTLQRFVDWFDRGDVEIVRDAAAQGDAVRLLTVHGAKGLQAPVVILADAAHDPDAGNRNEVVPWQGLPLVPPRKAERFGSVAEAVEQARRADRQEHWRLLYVAMTRAEERLVVAGSLAARRKGVVPEESWHAAVARGMQALGAQWEADPLWNGRLIWRGTEALPVAKAHREVTAVADPVEEPAWLRSAAPIEARPPRPLAPSAPVTDELPYPPPSAAQRAAAERGTWLHSLFERLPDIAPVERAGAADRWLARVAGVKDTRERAALVAHVLAVLNDSAFATLFSPEALAEAPIAAVVGGDVISGTVDRLLVTPDRVQIVDFKTGRSVPTAADAVPLSHLRQMAAYAAALAVIFPDRRIEAALLYTAGPTLILLPDASLTPHKPGFAATQDKLAALPVEGEGNSP
ncbi:double-strand break repair helicase AddA [Sphingobium algorifonticola]|uniref:DNA 3'-5' helicase n=1 Tax=Sphingobium algorifonticola TaxID=2008318 RepID=A0A437J6V0_9SPHN|nr:double-strand break repair helicase AddA [Sphingobium algorifonticola]RVT40879.1 double-strand break repair helicase AddA [Sphingobium algorifonticola]